MGTSSEIRHHYFKLNFNLFFEYIWENLQEIYRNICENCRIRWKKTTGSNENIENIFFRQKKWRNTFSDRNQEVMITNFVKNEKKVQKMWLKWRKLMEKMTG